MAETETSGAAAPDNEFVTETFKPKDPVKEAPKEPEKPAGEQEIVPAAEGHEAGGEAAGDPPSGEGDGKKPKQADPFQARIDKLTKNYREEQRKNQELAERIRLYEAEQAKAVQPAPQADQPNVAPTAEDLEKLAEQKAAQLVQQREFQSRVNSWYQAGKSDFPDDFDAKCNIVASLGASERPEFMQLVTDADIIPDGHKLVAALADDPTEAARILDMQPAAMAAALVRYSEKIGKPKAKAISGAPSPIKPLDGTAKTSEEPSDSDSDDDWFRKRDAQVRARQTSGARF